MYIVNKELCIGCQICLKECPAGEFIVLENGQVDIKNKNCISCGHCIAVCPKNAISCDNKDMSEIIDYNEDTFSVDSNNLLNFMKFRRSSRHFTSKEVDDESICKIIEAGRYCPTATNSEDVKYIVVKDKIDEVRDLMMLALKQKGEFILNKEDATDKEKFYGKVFSVMYRRYEKDKTVDKLFFNAKTIILVKSKNPQNASLASSYMELMTNSLGLGCCYIGFAIHAIEDNVELKDFLGVESDESISVCFAIGHSTSKFLRTTPKKKACITKL